MKYFLDLFSLENYRDETHKFISKRNKTYEFIKQD